MKESDNYYGYTFPENLFFGEDTRKAVDKIWAKWLNRKITEMHTFLRLCWEVSPDRLDRACRRALYYQCLSTSEIKSILEQNLDVLPLSPETDIEGQFKLDF